MSVHFTDIADENARSNQQMNARADQKMKHTLRCKDLALEELTGKLELHKAELQESHRMIAELTASQIDKQHMQLRRFEGAIYENRVKNLRENLASQTQE